MTKEGCSKNCVMSFRNDPFTTGHLKKLLEPLSLLDNRDSGDDFDIRKSVCSRSFLSHFFYFCFLMLFLVICLNEPCFFELTLVFWSWLGLTRNTDHKSCINNCFYFACEALITWHLPPRSHPSPISLPLSSPYTLPPHSTQLDWNSLTTWWF